MGSSQREVLFFRSQTEGKKDPLAERILQSYLICQHLHFIKKMLRDCGIRFVIPSVLTHVFCYEKKMMKDKIYPLI